MIINAQKIFRSASHCNQLRLLRSRSMVTSIPYTRKRERRESIQESFFNDTHWKFLALEHRKELILECLSPSRSKTFPAPKELLGKPIKTPYWDHVQFGPFNIPGMGDHDPDGLIGQNAKFNWRDRHKVAANYSDNDYLGIADPENETFNSGGMGLLYCKEQKVDKRGVVLTYPDGSIKYRTWFAKRFDMADPMSRMRAVREVVVPYVVALLDRPSLILTTFLHQETKDVSYVFRRFLTAGEFTWNFNRLDVNIATQKLVDNYFIRYCLCGDIDLNNMRNVLATNFEAADDGQRFSVKTRLFSDINQITNIDNEFAFPDKENFLFEYYSKYLLQNDFNSQYSKYDRSSPPFGSVSWIHQQIIRRGEAGFLDHRCASFNPMLMYLFDKFESSEDYLSKEVSQDILQNLILNLNYIDYSILSYGPSNYRIYSVDEINQSRIAMLEWLEHADQRRCIDSELLNHHAWAVRVATCLIDNNPLTLRECILAK